MKICLSCEGVSETPAERCGFCGAWLLPADAVHYPVRRGEVDAANPLLGTVIDGKYRLLGVLGRGGLGTVFRAQHTGSLMHVALKLLHPRFGERPEYRRALVPEARRAAAVAHEHCARLLDVGEAEDGAAYLVMELAEGRTLDLLVRDGALAPGHAVAILEQVAAALAAIHAVGLVHCDLSPRNVMVAASGGALRVKVLDFGIARSVALAGQARSHGEFQGFVNPAFSAPELLAGREVDARADLYSFGTLAWLLLTGGMPVDDADARKAAAAVLAGELRPWPEPRGVGRRLRRLALRCLQMDPEQRPSSIAAVARELAIVRSPRPALTRAGALTTALGAVALFATARPASSPFLQTVAGSPFALAAGGTATEPVVVDTTSARLATVRFDYAGFAPRRLRAHVVRGGDVLLRVDQEPEPEAGGGTLALSTAQAAWRTVVEGLARSGREHASDVVFLLPGAAPFGSVRLRVDDEAPVVAAAPVTAGAVLRADTQLALDVRDGVGVAAVTVRVRAATGPVVELSAPPSGGRFALGAALAAAAPDLAGPCEVEIGARDRAGNVAAAAPLAFAAVDVRAPRVTEVTGPQGEPFAPLVGGIARVRVRVADAVPGDEVAIQVGDGAAVVVPWPDAASQRVADVPVAAAQRAAAWHLVARDPAGNETAHELTPVLRDRSLAIRFPRVDGPARALAGELVLAAGGRATVAVSDNWTIVDLVAETIDGREVADPAFGWERLTPATAQLAVDALLPGAYRLVARLREGDAADALRALATATLRVLPDAIEVRVPAVNAPYLPALIEAGVLAARGESAPGAYDEGPAWSVDAGLRPYLRGRATWVAGEVVRAEELPVGDAGCALLPTLRPVRGFNTVSPRYVDVLDRAARLRIGEAIVPAGESAAAVSFWWSDEPPQQVGAETLVEHGRPARVRVRSPLPFAPGDAPTLRLGIGPAEVAAALVRVRDRADAEIVFDVSFAVWSEAASLADVPREQFAGGFERLLDASLATPAGRQPLALRLRTVRSTLQPLALAELRALPPALGALRLLPVLPPTGAFAEPTADGLPRAAYRVGPKVAVRNVGDVLMLANEFPVGAARDLAAAAAALPGAGACVHADDPRGSARLEPANLLPTAAATADAEAPLAGVDFFQAYTFARLLGLVVAGDADAMRLPLGVELEAAAFAGATRAAGHGAAAHGGAVDAAAFAPTVTPAARSVAVGDVVPSGFGQPFVGLDFGLREWTLDLPAAPGADALLREWIADGAAHLARAQALARGADDPAREALGSALLLGVVRGMAFVDSFPTLAPRGPLPVNVPGVLLTAQLRRDGRDLLSGGVDPRLAGVGFRIVADVDRLGVGKEAR
ncbi:MAG: serine/threonine protein kinase [Planctomycetes bacterium]|nr:serine/threonine protein kinase [Planctomycetota bacterium]